MSHSNVIPLHIPPKKRAANKLSSWGASPTFVAAVDALLDIQPRRTEPAACEVLIVGDRVYVASEEADGESIGTVGDLVEHLNGIADAAELDAEERAAVMHALEEARVT